MRRLQFIFQTSLTRPHSTAGLKESLDLSETYLRLNPYQDLSFQNWERNLERLEFIICNNYLYNSAGCYLQREVFLFCYLERKKF